LLVIFGKLFMSYFTQIKIKSSSLTGKALILIKIKSKINKIYFFIFLKTSFFNIRYL